MKFLSLQHYTRIGTYNISNIVHVLSYLRKLLHKYVTPFKIREATRTMNDYIIFRALRKTNTNYSEIYMYTNVCTFDRAGSLLF